MRWIAPAECPQASAFASALREQLPDASVRAQIAAIDGQVTQASKRSYGLSLSVQVNAQTAHRRLSAEGCEELLRAAVWLVVLAVGPAGAKERPDGSASERQAEASHSLGSEGKPHEAGADKQTPTQLNTDRTAADASEAKHAGESEQRPVDSKLASDTDALAELPKEREKRALHARLAAFGGVFAGMGAKVQGSLGIWADLSVGAMHTQVTLVDLLPANERVAGGGHVQVWSLALGLSECALWGHGVRLGPCVGIEGLRTAANSKDFGRAVNRSVLWAAMDVGLQLFWPLTRSLELNVSGTVAMPVAPRPRFTVAGVGSVAAASRFSEEAHLGLIYVAR